ncbi:MAG: cell wall-binding repeat-containing protein [Actinomycetia bacterium]|nr:cell wall-binding repeat-containing protein [Actinomycetes bacterium]
MKHSKLIRFVASVCACALAASIGAIPAQALEPLAIPDFTIHGGGYGHGIGLSQYGSQGHALHGWKYDAIVKHYFQGTTIATAAKNPDIKVHLAADALPQTDWTIRGVDATLTVRDSAGTRSYPKNTDYTFTCSGTSVVMKNAAGNTLATLSGEVTLDPVGGDSVFQVKDPSGPSGFGWVRWRGSAHLLPKSGKLLLLNVVTLKHYLYGVVPRESPASWKPEALKAQAVVAHSYAKAEVDPDDDGVRNSDSALYCTTSDQVYGGHSRLSQGQVVQHEQASTNAAVDATLGKLVKYGTTIVQTFFFSASGGHTANIEDSWGYSTPRPYYTGVDDPYEGDAGSPHSSWKVTMSGLTIAGDLKASSTVANELANHGLAPVPAGAGSSVWVTGVLIQRGVSGYPRWVTFRFSNGGSVKLTSYTVKSALVLKSPNFTFSGFPITRISGTDRYATAVALSKRTFSSTAPAVVIASGEQFADALAGSSLAGATKGALLLTAADRLPSPVASELGRLKPSAVYVLGGTGAVSAEVTEAVRAAVPTATVERIEGVDRYDTARKVADKTRKLMSPQGVIVVSGQMWPDAASASSLAYAKAWPIILTKQATLPPSAADYLGAAKPSTVVIAGGTAAVGSPVETAVETITGVQSTRIAGSDRYATSAALARYAGTQGFTFTEVYIATGESYADALAGAMLAGTKPNALVLSRRDTCPAGTASLLAEKRTTISQIWLLGGVGAISEAGLKAIDTVMMQ